MTAIASLGIITDIFDLVNDLEIELSTSGISCQVGL